MSNKVNHIISLLFVACTLLLLIGSVSADVVDLNENLEASLDLDDSSSIDDSISNPDNKVSNQIAISNIDDETDDTSSSISEDLDSENLNSKDVVSNNEDATINTKDSEKNIKTDDKLGDANFAIENIALNKTAKPGDEISFEISGQCIGTYDGSVIPVSMWYSETELHYLDVTANKNTVTVDTPDMIYGHDYKLFNCTSADGTFNFTVHFRVVSGDNIGNYAFVNDASNGKSAKTRIGYSNPFFELENKVSSPYTTVGTEVSFEITGRNKGTRYSEEYIPITICYDKTELSYVGFTPNLNSSSYSSLEQDRAGDWDILFLKYYTPNGFGDGDYFTFTLSFKAEKETGQWNPRNGFGAYAFVGTKDDIGSANFVDWGASNVTFVGPESNFALNLTSLNSELNNGANVNLGNVTSFEIFVRNLGGDFKEIVPLDIYFNSSELEYLGFQVGKIPEAPWYDASPNYRSPIVEDGHIFFAYDGSGLGGFRNNDCMNFTVFFKTLKVGSAGINALVNWTQLSYHESTASDTVIVGQDADFTLSLTPINSIVNVNDAVSYEVFAKNIGGILNNYEWLSIHLLFNEDELEYVDFTPAYDKEAYNPSPDTWGNGHLVFGYYANNAFANGDSLNFTVNFKAKCKSGVKIISTAYMDWNQIDSHNVQDSANVYATDADFIIDLVALDDLLQIGDIANFEVTAHNREGTYYGGNIYFDLSFNPDEFKYYNFTVNEQPRGSFDLDSDNQRLSSSSAGKLTLLAAPSAADPGRLRFVYTPTRAINPNCVFNFTVGFTVLAEGYLENNAMLSWGGLDSQTAYSGAAGVRAGQENFTLVIVPKDEKVQIDDVVEYILYLENTGNVPLYVKNNNVTVDDYYPGELEYINFTLNGATVNNVQSTYLSVAEDTTPGSTHLIITLPVGEDGKWSPGDYLNVTLRYKVKSTGIHCNHIFFNHTGTFGSVIVGQPHINFNKTTLTPSVDLYDLVYYEIFCENMPDSIPYYDHTRFSKDLVISDIYPDGLKFVGFKENSKNQDGTFTIKEGAGNNITIVFTPNEDRWYNGSYINFTLIFNATKVGKLVNNADFYWKWKDWANEQGPEENISITPNSGVSIGEPSFSLEKISNFENVKVGDILSYSLIYTNTGYKDLTGVYIIDRDYSEGLEYYDYSDKSLWTFNGKDRWDYNGVLKEGESVTLEILFKATTPGEKTNTAIGGNDQTNESNSTDTVLIKENETDTLEDSEEELQDSEDELEDIEDDFDDDDEGGMGGSEEENGDKKDKGDETNSTKESKDLPFSKTVSHNAAGNPLFVLLLALLTLCFVSIKGKK